MPFESFSQWMWWCACLGVSFLNLNLFHYLALKWITILNLGSVINWHITIQWSDWNFHFLNFFHFFFFSKKSPSFSWLFPLPHSLPPMTQKKSFQIERVHNQSPLPPHSDQLFWLWGLLTLHFLFKDWDSTKNINPLENMCLMNLLSKKPSQTKDLPFLIIRTQFFSIAIKLKITKTLVFDFAKQTALTDEIMAPTAIGKSKITSITTKAGTVMSSARNWLRSIPKLAMNM